MKQIYEMVPVHLQDIILTCYGLKLYHERYGKKFTNLYRKMDQLQWSSRDEIEYFQIERLREIIKHASLYVPFYKEYMKNEGIHYSDIKTINDLRCFPVIRKSQMKLSPHMFISKKKQPTFLGHTSGTTGSPFNISYSQNVGTAMAVCDWRHMHACGRNRKDRIAVFLGRVIVPLNQSKPPFWRHNYVHNEVWFSSFHLKDLNMEAYIKEIKRLCIGYIKAYPSTAYILAKFCLKKKQKLQMKGVLTSSETLHDHQRAIIEEAFSCRVYDYYGHAERAIFATECDQHDGLHVNEDFGIIECLDKNNLPVRSGETGVLVGTSLFNFVMPFIRYETGDLSNFIESSCSCKRSFKKINAVTTKAEDIIKTPDGRMVSPSILTHPFKPIDTIKESQIIQKKLDQIIVKLVVNSHFSSAHQNLLENGLRERLGDKIRVSIIKTDFIEREKSGKFRWVISNVGLSTSKMK
ncbi:MAG: phenylacetate--CoA ligase family protein [Bacteroidetes bacterium]|nr:phenylacetate--CoA ligase family protein [Bacteroidota bacterium]